MNKSNKLIFLAISLLSTALILGPSMFAPLDVSARTFIKCRASLYGSKYLSCCQHQVKYGIDTVQFCFRLVKKQPSPATTTNTCPDGSAPDANGKCPPVSQGSPSTDQQGTTQSQDNTPSKNKHKLPKGGEVLAPPIDQQGG